jgi:HAE1 family hydrophobic/amphiphilic exporter-1
MSLSAFAVRRPVAVSMFFLAVVLLGLISYPRLPIDLLPDLSYPQLVVYTAIPQTSAIEVERLVTEKVEAQVSSVPGVDGLSSVSRDGISLVTLSFQWGTDMDMAMLNLRERLDHVRQALPITATRPQILRVNPSAEPVMVLSMAGDDLWETKELAENVVRRRLEQLDGVAQAQVSGGPERQIHVEVDLELLEANGLTMQTVAQALDAANRATAGGTILKDRTRYPLRTLGEFQTVAEISDVVITDPRSASGSRRTLRIGDVARVVDGFADRDVLARYNGRESVGILVYKDPGANTVHAARQVERIVGLLQEEFPAVNLDVASSQAGFIADSIDNVFSALMVGGMLAFLVLFVFLREPRYPVAVALAIPISVGATFVLLWAFDVSINIMSLGGLALGVGMLVDNSIVVLENIFRHQEAGSSAKEAAAKGGREVSGAITASTLTTILVFGPVLYVEGIAGELFRDLSLAVAFSLLASLAVALTLLPTLAARFTGPGRALGGATPFDHSFNRFASVYHGALGWSLDHRGLVLGVAGVALALGALSALLLDRNLLPSVDQGALELLVELPEGTALFRTHEVSMVVEDILLQDADVEAVWGTVGRDIRRLPQTNHATGLHTAHFQVRVRDGVSSRVLRERFRIPLDSLLADEGRIAIQTGGSTTLGMILGGSDADIAIRIRGQDLEAAFDYADQVALKLSDAPRIANVRVGNERSQPQIGVQVLRDEIHRFGLEAATVANAVDQTMRGILATEFVAFDRKIPVMVRLPDEARFTVETLNRIKVSGVPLRELVRVDGVQAPAEVRRESQGRVVSVLADVRFGGLDAALVQVEDALANLPVPHNFRVEVGGENEEMLRSFRNLKFAFALALILVFMILAAQFESFLYPATILAAVPVALVGAIVALLIRGEGLNTMSLIGIVILVGIVVNDSIVKVDFIVRARAQGAGTREAILEAGRVRLRPIVMTTLTTVLGLAPMAMGLGRGADLRAPLAISVIGGLILATGFTLIVVPVIFSLLESARMTTLARRDKGTGQKANGAGTRPSQYES